jgi:PII-like signaling protein
MENRRMAQSTVMVRQGVNLRFFMLANARHDGMLLYEWLLEQARRGGLAGGSVFRAVAGFGRHGVLHEESFFELAGDLPLNVEFVLGADEAERLLDIVRAAGAELVYVRTPVEYGVIARQAAAARGTP